MTIGLTSARLVFAGGGTGGHLYPAIAIADRITELLKGRAAVEIIFVGTRRGLEFRQRETLGYPLHLINIRGLARRLTLTNLLVPFLMIGAAIQAHRLLKRFSPDIVVGTGGYVSWPVVSASARRGIPVVLQEQNSFPGVTTRRMASKAARLYLGFAGAQEYLPSDRRVLVTGNPVRHSVVGGKREEAVRYFKLDPARKTILILGGSQGARVINQAVLRSLQQSAFPTDYQLLWQTGKRDYTEVIAAAGRQTEGHSLFPFENHMDLVYAAADLAVARAGAISLAELEACAVPSLLIPYALAAGGHQRKNAQEFVSAGYADLIDESALPQTDLLGRARAMLASGEADRMRAALCKTNRNKRPAVDIIAEDIIKLISQSSVPGGALGH